MGMRRKYCAQPSRPSGVPLKLVAVCAAPGMLATPLDIPVDWLDSGDGLLRWLAQANLVPADALHELKARAMPGDLDKVADQARALREWFRKFVHKYMGRPLPAKALQELGPLNKLPQYDEAFSQIPRHRARWRSTRTANRAALAISRIVIVADWRSAGEVRM